MKKNHLILPLLILLSSCMQLLPEGRKLAQLRMEHEKQLNYYNNKKLVLISRQAEVDALQKKIRKTRESASNKENASTPANNELNRLRKELKQKQAELEQLEQELLLSN